MDQRDDLSDARVTSRAAQRVAGTRRPTSAQVTHRREAFQEVLPSFGSFQSAAVAQSIAHGHMTTLDRFGRLSTGVGFGMVGEVMILAVQNAADPAQIGTATRAVNLFRALGGSVGVALYGALQQPAGHVAGRGGPGHSHSQCALAGVSGRGRACDSRSGACVLSERAATTRGTQARQCVARNYSILRF